jgi:uncharacterized protein (TIGR02246 family)
MKFACAVALLLPVLSAAGETAGPRPVLVTVDDLPIAQHTLATPEERKRITRALLAALAKHKIRAVALVTWANAILPSDAELLRMWLDAGHELGNHSWNHLSYTATDSETYIADIEKARARLEEFLKPLGKKSRFFRFPFLREGDTREKLEAMRRYLDATGQINLPVTIDNDDWAYAAPWTAARRAGDKRALARVAEQYHEHLHQAFRRNEANGDRLFGRPVPQILLLHANEVGSAQWDALFTWVEQTGHVFATADEVLADAALREPNHYVNEWGPSLWDRISNDRHTAAALSQVKSLLTGQAEAWNRGDLEAFCSVYADDAVFASPSGFHTGRAVILERYRKRYPTPDAMGRLSFDFLDLRVSYSSDATHDIRSVTVAARWAIEYADKPAATGLTLLVLLQRGKGWTIVQDASM